MIEIHLDGRPVKKLEAARAAANLGRAYETPDIRVVVPGEDGWISGGYITVHARHHAYGDMQPPSVSCPSAGRDAAGARTFAEMLALGAEIAELAAMLAAEQDDEEPASEPAQRLGACLNKYDHLGNTDYCQRDEDHDGQHAGHMGRRWSAGPA